MTPESVHSIAADLLAYGVKISGTSKEEDELAASEERALSYLGDPEGYARDLLGSVKWSKQQREVVEEMASAILEGRPSRILAKGGHGTCKSHAAQDGIMWAWDVASRRQREDRSPQGCDLILTAPTASNIERTSYYGLLSRARHAARLGHIVPGRAPRPKEGYRGASTASVKWQDGPWRMIGISPKETADGDVAHSAGGTHHPYLSMVLIEEIMGMGPGMVKAIEGLTVAQRVLIMATTNPTSRRSFIYAHIKASPGQWLQVPFSQVDHPNVVARREVIKGAVSHLALEAALRSSSFEDRGSTLRNAGLSEEHLDIVYALPSIGMPDKTGPRADGIPGHPDAEPHVFRPVTGEAAGQHLGTWLEADAGALLFHVSQIGARMASGGRSAPDGPPDQVGVDCALTRQPVACPRWGPSARRAFDLFEAEKKSPPVSPPADERGWETTQGRTPPGFPPSLSTRTISSPRPPVVIVGMPEEIPWIGSGALEKAESSAGYLVGKWGTSCRFAIDRAFGGELGAALNSRGAKVDLVEFQAAPVGKPLDLYGPAANRRAEMAMDAAAGFNAALVSSPYSQRLLTEMEAFGSLEVSINKKGTKKLREKKDITRDLGGKSPDFIDSVMLALSGGRQVFHW